MGNDGKEYELFVAKLQQAILDSEKFSAHKNIKAEVNKKILDNWGIERQFDVYWEYELGGLTYKTVIECKDYNSNVSIEKIDALIGKTMDIPDLKSVFATKKGYQSGAKTKADQNKIELLIVREQVDSDWIDDEGRPLIKKISMNMCVLMPAHIHKFEPILDSKWLKENTTINTSQTISIPGLDNEIFINDIDKTTQYSLHEIESKLVPLNGEEHGVFEMTEKFENAFFCHRNLNLKITAYKIKYSIPKPIYVPIEIDGTKELIGVIEYLQKGTKRMIFRNQ